MKAAKLGPNDADVLQAAFLTYGSIFVVLLSLFVWVRQRYKRPYTLRQWIPTIQTSLAEDQFGYMSWMWSLSKFSDEEMMDECGLDSVCFLRSLLTGTKICLLGMLNAAWLMPLYATAPSAEETASGRNDWAVRITISNVPSGSTRLMGAVVAAYMLFLYTMYLILQDLKWFIELRHKWLARPKVENYTVCVRSIPPEFCSNQALAAFFRRCFGEDSVYEARIRIKVSKLASLVKRREAVRTKLEHATAFHALRGRRLRHSESWIGGNQVDSIETYLRQLEELNDQISQRIEAVERWQTQLPVERPTSATDEIPAEDGNDNDMTKPLLPSGLMAPIYGARDAAVQSAEAATTLANRAGLLAPIHGARNIAVQSAETASATVRSALTALDILGEEGQTLPGGFVTFTKLWTASEAQQLVHHTTPFTMQVVESPEPHDVFWSNVGRTHDDLQLGQLLSFVATGALCLLWTIPISFIASLSTLESLRKAIPLVDELIDVAPFLGPLFEILAPLLVLITNASLPTILRFLSMFEGPVSKSEVEASLFSKLATFTIIQTGFVSAVAGGILQAISDILDKPKAAIDLLANTLPTQSTYFVQIIILTTITMVVMELLRVVPLVMAFLRCFIGPRLTEAERQRPYLGIRPLACPSATQRAIDFNKVVLYFFVLFVYQVIAPLSSFVLYLCFLFLLAAYRHQFIYIYPNMPDSGGKIWIYFIQTACLTMLMAVATMIGFLSLKKGALSTPLLLPLFVLVWLFRGRILQEYVRTASYLPSMENENEEAAVTRLPQVAGAFLQPELQAGDVSVPPTEMETDPSAEEAPAPA